MSLIISILCISAAGAILCDGFEPLEQFKNWLGLGKERKLYHKNKIIDYIIYLIHHMINCVCISFWLGFYFYNIWIGFLCFFIASIMYKKMNKLF